MQVLTYIVGIFVVLSVIYSLYHCSTNSRMFGNDKVIYITMILIIPVIGMVMYFKQDQKRLYFKRLNELTQAKKEMKVKK